MAKEKQSDLAAAALAYDAEVRRFEELAAAARKTKLNSERGIARAAEALQKAGESQQRILENVQKIVAAMNAGRGAQEQEAQALFELGQRITQRRQRYGEVLQKMAALGGQAAEIQKMLTEGNDLEGVRARMDAAATDAEAIAAEARSEDLEDLERRATSLRQQLLSAMNKLKLLEKKNR